MISFLLSAGSLLLSFGQEINETAPYSKCEGSEPEHIIFKPAIDTDTQNKKDTSQECEHRTLMQLCRIPKNRPS